MKANELKGFWSGQTVVCIASGPSLTAADVAAVEDLPAIAVNSSFRAAPWARMMYANDAAWWTANAVDVKATFSGHKFCYSRASIQHGAVPLQDEPWVMAGCNSGATAIRMALRTGAGAVLLLGFDCKFTDGVRHWHPDHVGMTNCESINRWPAQFQRVADEATRQGTRVVNCTRDTSLTCFERGSIEQLLYTR